MPFAQVKKTLELPQCAVLGSARDARRLVGRGTLQDMVPVSREQGSTLVGAAVVAIGVSATLALPEMVGVALLAAGSALLLTKPWGRLIIFIGGAMLVLQSGGSVSAAKVAYFAMALIVILIATARCTTLLKERWGSSFRPAALGSILMALVIVIGSVTGLLNGQPLTDVIRDGMTYVLIAGGVPVALDAASSVRTRMVDLIVIGVGIFGGASFALRFLSARGVNALDIERIGLASMMVLTIGVALGLVRGLLGPRILWGWLLFAALLVAFVLATGSRTGLILLVAAVGVLGRRSDARVSLQRIGIGLAGMGAVVSMLLLIATVTVTTREFFSTRIQATIQTIQQGAGSDASGVIRARATEYAMNVWREHWFFGVGFGNRFPDPNPGGGFVEFQVDTAALFLAKFGLVGTVLIAIALACIIRPAWGRIDDGLRLPEQTAMAAASLVWVATLIFGATTEDKGFSIAVMLGLLLIASSLRERLESQLDPGQVVATIRRIGPLARAAKR